MEIIATTFAGFEQILADEIYDIGGRHIQIMNRAVSFDGNKRLMYMANMHLRTALRILTPIKKTRLYTDGGLYNFIKKDIDWSKFIDTWDKFIIDPVVWSKNFSHSHYVALKAKDAIVDQFREKTKRRPTVNGERPTLRINLHIMQEDCTLSLDSSDEPLFKRGYRIQGHDAPLNEVSASAILILSGWDRKSDLIDPMCGSGTLPIEAGLMATNTAPGLCRKEFGFMRWKNYDPKLWAEVVQEAKDMVRPAKCQIFGFDKSPVNVVKAKENVTAAGMDDLVTIDMARFEKLKSPVKGPGLIISNPPYDERLAIKNLNKFYATIGDKVREEFTDWKTWYLTSNAQALNYIGTKGREYKVRNGALDCVFREVRTDIPHEDPEIVEKREAEAKAEAEGIAEEQAAIRRAEKEAKKAAKAIARREELARIAAEEAENADTPIENEATESAEIKAEKPADTGETADLSTQSGENPTPPENKKSAKAPSSKAKKTDTPTAENPDSDSAPSK